MMPAGQLPEYPFDPSYPRYASASASALPTRRGRHHLIIILVSALVAVVVGVAVLAVLRGKRDPGTPAGMNDDKPRVPPLAPPNPPAMTPTAPPAVPPAAPTAPAEPSLAAPADAAGAAASDPAAGAAPPEVGTCFAEVSSVPAGAEIVIDQTNVIGTTPQKVTLPCGNEVELVIRKARFLPATRTITPTAEGAKLKVALARPTFLVKVSSTPPGATITMNGKSLGVTPTTVKIPSFEASMLTFAKDGFATETEKVTPKSNGAAVHTTLKRLERRKPR